jgi:hypothetical protein
LIALVLMGLVVTAAVGIFVVVGLVKLADAFSSDTAVTLTPKAVDGQVEFELTYGEDVTGIAQFIVQDADGKDLWKLRGSSNDKLARIAYGVIPDGPPGSWRQEFPAEGTQPADIRGKRIKIEVGCRFIVAFGAGRHSTRTEFDVPK